MMKSRIIIVGKGGSGKDLLKDRFISKGYKPSISFTTRPKREKEIHGETYNFIDKSLFKSMIDSKMFFEYKEFRGWFYGTAIMELEIADLFIMTPPAIVELDKEIRDTSMVIYINIEESIREQRLSNRNDADSIQRRLKADREMFDDFTDFDLEITNPKF